MKANKCNKVDVKFIARQVVFNKLELVQSLNVLEFEKKNSWPEDRKKRLNVLEFVLLCFALFCIVDFWIFCNIEN